MPGLDKSKDPPVNELMALSHSAGLLAAAEQRQSEEKFQAVFELSPDAIFLAHVATGRIVEANAAASKLLQRPLEQIIGMHQTQLHPPEQLAEAQTAFAFHPAAGKDAPPVELEVVCADQSRKPVEIRGRVINLDGDAYVLGTFRDISDRKQAEAALRENTARFGAVLKNTAIVVFDQDQELRYTRVFNPNPGCSEEFVLGKTDADLLSPIEAARLTELKQRVLQTGCSDRQIVQTTIGGRVFCYDLTIEARYDSQGNIAGISCAAMDITERQQADAQLAEYAQRLALATESAGIGIWDWDVPTNTLVWDKQSLELYHIKPEEFAGNYSAWENRVHPDDLAAVNAELEAALAGEKEFHTQFRIVWPDGQIRFVEGHALVLHAADGTPRRMIGVNWDITDRVKLTQENEKLQKQFYQAQKMESIGQLAGGIAHDFNNLLVPIIGYAELGMTVTPETNRLHGNFLQIKKAGDRAAKLTRQILAFSRQQILDMAVLDLNEVIIDFEKMLNRLIGDDITLHTNLTSPLLPIRGDQGQLEQVVLNLAVNARDAMPTGGQLTLETANFILDEAYAAKHPEVQPGPHVMLAVSDTGHGMTIETQERIFEPFFTTKPRGSGTGLGLATVFGIVRQHGGSVEVNSQLARGTTFKIYLPAVGTTLPDVAIVPPAAESVSGTETILVVEDEQGVRQLVRYTLEQCGYHILEAAGSEQGLSLAADYCGPIHLLLTDVVMPEMDGPMLYRYLAQERANLKVLYMSGYTNDIIDQHRRLNDEVAVLAKPFAVRDLLLRVRSVLEQ